MLDTIKAFLRMIWSRTVKMILGLLMVITGGALHAQDSSYPRDITLSWTNPSQYEDGSNIAAGDLDSVRFECSNNTTPSVLVVDASLPDNGEGAQQSNTWVDVIPAPGTYTCYAWAKVVTGAESQPSSPANKQFFGTPLPPVILTFD